jgi:hypothetical protein
VVLLLEWQRMRLIHDRSFGKSVLAAGEL